MRLPNFLRKLFDQSPQQLTDAERVRLIDKAAILESARSRKSAGSGVASPLRDTGAAFPITRSERN